MGNVKQKLNNQMWLTLLLGSVPADLSIYSRTVVITNKIPLQDKFDRIPTGILKKCLPSMLSLCELLNNKLV